MGLNFANFVRFRPHTYLHTHSTISAALMGGNKIPNKNSDLIVILGDFNAKSSNWSKHDTTTYEGSKIDAITSQLGLKQLIQEPTHILRDSLSCIDLILTSQPNLVMESGVHSSLYQNCYHQLMQKLI